MMLGINTGIPIPKTTRTVPATQRKYPFAEMEVGAMFFVPNKTKNTMATHTSTIAKRLGRKFATRMLHMVESLDGWELAEKDAEGAVLGIGVWRVE